MKAKILLPFIIGMPMAAATLGGIKDEIKFGPNAHNFFVKEFKYGRDGVMNKEQCRNYVTKESSDEQGNILPEKLARIRHLANGLQSSWNRESYQETGRNLQEAIDNLIQEKN